MSELDGRFTILYLDANAQAYGNLYGAQWSLLELARRLDRERFAVHAIVRSNALRGALQALGAVAHSGELRHLVLRDPRVLPRFGQQLLRSWHLVRRTKPDLIHANGVFCNHYAAALGSLARIPSVCHTRTQVTRLQFWKYGAFLSSAIVATSSSEADTWRPLLRRGQQLRVVYNGVDTERFRFDETRREAQRGRLGVGSQDLVFAQVAWIGPLKRQDLFIRALRRACREAENCVGLVVGDVLSAADVRYRERLQAMTRQFGLQGRLRFTGFVQDMPTLYPAIDVLVMPSQTEGCPRAVLEAMAAERPVIATDVGGLRDIVRHGQTGLLVPSGDESALADAIVTLARNPDMRREMGKAARRQVGERFSVGTYVHAIQAIYEELLRDP